MTDARSIRVLIRILTTLPYTIAYAFDLVLHSSPNASLLLRG